MRPVEALRAWTLLFIDYIAANQIIAPALNTLVGGTPKVFEAPARKSREPSMRWWREQSKAAIYVRI
jgi:hypothetical protein